LTKSLPSKTGLDDLLGEGGAPSHVGGVDLKEEIAIEVEEEPVGDVVDFMKPKESPRAEVLKPKTPE